MFQTICAKHANKFLTIVLHVPMVHNAQLVTAVKTQSNIQMENATCVM